MRVLTGLLVFLALLLLANDIPQALLRGPAGLTTLASAIADLSAWFSPALAGAIRSQLASPAAGTALAWLLAAPASAVLTFGAVVSAVLERLAARMPMPAAAPRPSELPPAQPSSTPHHPGPQHSGTGHPGLQQPEAAAAPSAQPSPPSPPGRSVAVAAPMPVFARADREFLPAALEILVTPPAPLAGATLMSISGALLAGLAWSYFTWIDIYAVAYGKVQPSGRSKVVQPLDAGKVVAIRVDNGSVVKAGDVVLELDATESGADREAMARDLEAARAEAARRRAAIAGADLAATLPAIEFPPDVPPAVRDRERGVLKADIAQLASSLASLQAQLSEKQATKQKLTASIAARGRLLALGRERIGMRQEIQDKGAGSRAMVIEAQQQYETVVTTDVSERGQLLETDAAIASLERKMQEVRAQFSADQTQKLAEIERKRDRMEQELVKAQSKSDHTQIKAPIDGTVQQLSVTTIGQVVASGQSLLTIVPIDSPIEIEAMIANKDVGFVEVGQAAIVKIEAFPFTRFGSIDATVVKMSRDAVDNRDGTALSDVSHTTKPQTYSQGQPPGISGNLVFPATIKLARNTLKVEGKEVPLVPGMAATVEIRTGQRRAIDFLLSPVREVATMAAHER